MNKVKYQPPKMCVAKSDEFTTEYAERVKKSGVKIPSIECFCLGLFFEKLANYKPLLEEIKKGGKSNENRNQ